MDHRGHAQAFQLGPERVVVRMGEIMPFNKHGPDEGTPEMRQLGHPAQFFQRKIHVLERQHGRGIESRWGRLTEIGQPVVIGSGQCGRHIRVLDQMKALGKPGGV